VTGDFYDFLELPDGKLGIAIGDVSGKGVGAGMPAAFLQGALRGLASVALDPRDLVGQVNNVVSQVLPADRFASLFYGQYDPATRRSVYVNAGHNPPVVLRKRDGGCQVLRLEVGGRVIGPYPEPYQQGEFLHEGGDLVVLFTDGISESMSARCEEWGEERLIELVQLCNGLSARECAGRILAGAERFAGRAQPHDDMMVVVLRIA